VISGIRGRLTVEEKSGAVLGNGDIIAEKFASPGFNPDAENAGSD
jgi:hypothetical protein